MHPFTDIEIKENACEMLDGELTRKRKKIMIKTGAMSDPYMPIKEVLKLSRSCFEIIYKHGFGLSFQTKSTLFLDDLDLLEKIHNENRLVIQITITTCDDDLCRKIEPGVEVTSERIEAMKILKSYGIPVIVWLSPILPFINDQIENLKCILEKCYNVGVKGIIWYGPGLTLRVGNRDYFYRQLDDVFPGLKKVYQKEFGNRYIVESRHKDLLNQYFIDYCESHKMMHNHKEIFDYINYFNEKKYEQLTLF